MPDFWSGVTKEPVIAPENRWPRCRIQKAIVLAIFGIVAVALIIRLSSVFIPVGFALLLAYILEPLICFMDRHHSRRLLTVSIFYVLFLGIVVTGIILIVPPLIQQGKAFVGFVQEQGEKYDITLDMLSGISEDKGESETASEHWWNWMVGEDTVAEESTNDVQNLTSPDPVKEEYDTTNANDSHPVGQFFRRHASMISERMPTVAIGAIRAIVNSAGNVAGVVIQVVLALFYAFFFMLHLPAIRDAFASWVPRSEQEEVDDVFKEIDEVVAGFFRGRLLVSLISAVITSVGLLISGITFWLLLGIAAGFLGLIPFIGVIITMIPAVLIALTSEQSFYSVVGVLITFGIVEGIVDPFVGPFVISHKVRLHPVTITIALMAGGVLFGLLGVFLAIPACGILKILARRYLAPAVWSVMRPHGRPSGCPNVPSRLPFIAQHVDSARQ